MTMYRSFFAINVRAPGQNRGKEACVRKGGKPMERTSALGRELKKLKRNYDLFLLFLPVIAFYVIFKYIPMYGVLLAFKDYKMKLGILSSPWAGFKYFRQLFSTPSFFEVLRNTVSISLQRIIFGFPAPIILALLLNEITAKRFKKTVQTVSYLPHFLSWVVLGGVFTRFLSPADGAMNTLIKALGGTPVYFLGSPSTYVPTIIITGIWQSIGWGSIVYLAAIAGISPDLYESAMLDGATRLQKMWYITLPSILPTIVVLLILRMGSVLNGGFDQIFNTYNDAVLSVADILDTYVYRRGLEGMQYSFSAAAELFKTGVGFFFVYSTNLIARKLGESSLW